MAPIDVFSGKSLDLGTLSFSTAAGTGFIKNGSGVLATAGGQYSGGFTLNAGTVIARGVDAMGGSATNVLTLNGGTVASDATRSFTSAKYGGGIVIGGNVQFGELAANVALASSSANLSFANNVSLGASTYTLASTHAITVGDTVGTSISTPGAGVLTYDGTIADLAGKTGAWAKQGGGTLALGGVSNYSGATFINNGVLQLTTGNDRLPTGTVVNLGQAVSTNLGTLDLNGRNQQIAGLNSTTGTNATASNNTVTSSTSATLTIGGTGNYNYGDATNTNSGIIAGAISLVKSGSGTQTLGDANIFTGAGAPTLLSHLFSSFSATGGLDSSGGVAGQGLFSFNGSTATLNWTAVPEPTSAMAVIVLGAGLMRRRRMA